MLLERPGEVVTRDEMRARLWPDGTFVDFDNNISSAMGKLRMALGDSAAAPRYIETVGRGYRFAAEVVLVSAGAHALPEPAVGKEFPTVLARRSSRLLGAIAAVILIVGAGVISYSQYHRHRSQPLPAGKLMLAVLPFENLTGDPAQEYFSDGFTEEMITQLGRLDPRRLGVIARTSVMPYKTAHQQVDRIGRDLGVQYVLEGSVRRDSNHVRITAQLIQVRDQSHLLAREYDREVTDVLVLQNDIAQEIADEIQLALADDKPASTRRTPLSPQSYEGYDLYLKGRYFWNKRNAEGFKQAIDYFQRAIAKDPQYARAYAGLADSYALMSSYYLGSQTELMPKARTAALEALRIDDGLAEAHTSLALISENYDWDWQSAEKQYRRAIELDPNYATAHQWYAELLAFQGRFDEALQESERARQLDPLSLIIAADRGAILYFSRKYPAAIEQFRAVIDMDPTMVRPEGLLIYAYAQQGRSDEALRLIDRLLAKPFPAWAWAYRACVFSQTGQRERAFQAAKNAEELARREGQDPGPMLAITYAAMGRNDEAFVWLEQARRVHSNLLTSLKVDPVFDPLRSDPRFQDLLREVRLAQ